MEQLPIASVNARKKLIFNKLGYEPSDEQGVFHFDGHKIRQVAGGERGGKSYSSAMDYMGEFWRTDLCWLVAADYERTRPEFNYIAESLAKLGGLESVTKRIDPGEIHIRGGAKIATRSAKDPLKLASEAPDFIIICEASQVDWETFLRCYGRLLEKRGRMIMSGTFESSLGWYAEKWQEWQSDNLEDAKSFSIPTWANKAIFPLGQEDPEIQRLKAIMPDDRFQERHGGVPCPPTGIVFKEFRNALHVTADASYDSTQPVFLAIDPGYASAYSVLAVQFKGDDVFVVDEIYERGKITEEIIQIAQQRPWWKAVEGGAIDIAAKQHQGMPAVIKAWQEDTGLFLKTNKVDVVEGIARLRTFLLPHPVTRKSLLHINPNCRGLISELGGCPSPFGDGVAVYRYKQTREGFIIDEKPDDKNNHSIKALIYLLIEKFGYTRPTIKRTIKRPYKLVLKR